MASEQTTVRKKKLRNLAKEEHHHPILYRHQDCIPSIKLFQNCERQNSSSLKNSKDFGCHEKEQAKTDIKENIKLLNSKVKNDEKSEKSVRKAKLSPEQNSDTTANKEELSKSRRRRLRKRRLLVSLAPSLNSVKPSPSTENNLQSKPVPQPLTRPSSVVPLAHNTSTNKSSDPAKSSAKDSRKRPDKSVGSRIKSIKSKSLIESTNQSKAEIIKTLEEKTLSSLLQTLVPFNNSSPKKEKPPVPLFSFPEKRLSSGSPKVDKDGVFYFGETKHQLEKLSPGFSKYNTSPVQEKSEFPQKTELNINCYSANKLSNLENSVPTFKFSPVNNERLSSLATIKRNLYETETFVPAVKKDSNKRVFSVGSPDSKINESMSTGLKSLNPFQSLNLCKPAISSSSVSLQNNLELCATNFAEKIHGLNSTENTNILSSVIPVSKADSEASQIVIASNTNPVVMKPIEEKSSKTREEIKMEREAKKAAKLAAKTKHKPVELSKANVSSSDTSNLDSKVIPQNMKDIKLQKKDIKVGHETLVVCQRDKSNTSNDANATSDKVAALSSASLIGATNNVNPSGESKGVDQDSSIKSKAELKAERRAKQEAQRAAKEVGKNVQQQPKEKIVKKECPKPSVIVPVEKKTEVVKTNIQPKPKLFSHLYQEKTHLTSKQLLSVKGLHPAILRLGVQYASRVVVGSNARCIALLHALKQMVNDYTTPTEKEFSRGLEEELGPVTEYLNQCRLLAVSMTNALRHIKRTLTQLPNNITDVEARRKICDVVDTYIHDQVDKAGEQIRNTVKQKIADGDVILTYGCSSLVYQILVESHQRGTKFRVVVVDGLPWREGREMLRKLVNKGLSCTYVLITAASFIMREASKVLLGAHALLANGYVMSRAGSSQVALLAHCYNVPVLVCCETHKFCERVQTDAFVYNELGELCYDNIKESKDKTRAPTSLTPLSLAYDVTPPDLVSAVVTEVAVLPCTSVPVILRIKPSESAM